MNELLLEKAFREHHEYPKGEYIPSESIADIPVPIYFLNDEECPCVWIKSDRTLHTSYYIGVDWLNKDKAIYVEPKLNRNSNEQTDYLRMLFSALKHPEVSGHTDKLFEIKWELPQIDIQQRPDLLTPLLVVQFLSVLKVIVRKGLKKSYYKVESNLYAKVKGKVMVSQTIKKNLLKNKPLNTYCSYDEFGLNSLENRLLKKALVFVQRYLPTLKIPNSKEYTTDMFNYINPAFEFVSEAVELNDVKYTKTNAFYKEYREALRLAKLILKRFGYNITNTQQKAIKTPPFWIDMTKLFELYVLGILKERYRNDILYGTKEAKLNYGLPDYLYTKHGSQCILDAKYKLIYNDEKYDIDNIRQLSGYARDERIFGKLGVAKNMIIDCLIIYPYRNAVGKSDEGFEIDLAKANPIEYFEKFKSLGVPLPLCHKEF